MVLGGDWSVVAVAAAAAILVDVLQRQMRRRRLPAFYQQVAGGLLATLIAVGVAATPADVSPSLVISSSIVMLLAGVNFLGAIQDALTGFPLTASARILEAFLATAGVVAGVGGGLRVAEVLGVDLGPVDPGAYSTAALPLMVVGGAIAAAAYAFSAYAPPGRCRRSRSRPGSRSASSPRSWSVASASRGRRPWRPFSSGSPATRSPRAPGSRRWWSWPPASRRSCPVSRYTADWRCWPPAPARPCSRWSPLRRSRSR